MDRVLYAGRTHPKIFFKAIVFQVLIGLLIFVKFKYFPILHWEFIDRWAPVAYFAILFLLELLYVLLPLLRWYSTRFELTTRHARVSWGVLYRQAREVDIRRIASIGEERGILDRIFGCGTLNFYDAAAFAQPHTAGFWNRSPENEGVSFIDVPHVKRVRRLVEQARYGD